LGVDVASFGDFFADRDGPKHLPARHNRDQRKNKGDGDAPKPQVKALTYRDPFQNIYKKYLFTEDGKYLLGGMMIGDTADYVKLVATIKEQKPLEIAPGELIIGNRGEDDPDDLPDDTQVCSCHNVTKGGVASVVKDGTCKSLGDV
jgi:nitrite reductase (NAD(P)H)